MSDESKKNSEANASTNPDDLAKLLDSALDGFSKNTNRTTDDELDSLMEEADAKAAQTAARDFQSMLQQMLAVQEEALKKTEETGEPKEDAETMMRAMKELMACSGAIADAGSPEELVAKLNELGGPDGSMEPMMNMMMQAFISKDVLYPPLKEMQTEYPKFLESNKTNLDEDTYTRYEKQYKVIVEVCEEFEKEESEEKREGEGGSSEGSPMECVPEKMEKIGRLLVELQSYGYPPAELTGGLPPGFGMSPMGIPRVEDASLAADACSIM